MTSICTVKLFIYFDNASGLATIFLYLRTSRTELKIHIKNSISSFDNSNRKNSHQYFSSQENKKKRKKEKKNEAAPKTQKEASMERKESSKLNIAIIHPDLGIGN